MVWTEKLPVKQGTLLLWPNDTTQKWLYITIY